MRPLARVLHRAVQSQAELAGKLLRPDVTPLCVTDEQVIQLLAEIEQTSHASAVDDGWLLTDSELVAERELRAAAGQLGVKLPLDELHDRVKLGEREIRMLLVCVAPEIE